MDKNERLKKIWLDIKRKSLVGGVEARTVEEQDEISTSIVELTRKIRFRMD